MASVDKKRIRVFFKILSKTSSVGPLAASKVVQTKPFLPKSVRVFRASVFDEPTDATTFFSQNFDLKKPCCEPPDVDPILHFDAQNRSARRVKNSKGNDLFGVFTQF